MKKKKCAVKPRRRCSEKPKVVFLLTDRVCDRTSAQEGGRRGRSAGLSSGSGPSRGTTCLGAARRRRTASAARQPPDDAGIERALWSGPGRRSGAPRLLGCWDRTCDRLFVGRVECCGFKLRCSRLAIRNHKMTTSNLFFQNVRRSFDEIPDKFSANSCKNNFCSRQEFLICRSRQNFSNEYFIKKSA